MKELAVFINQSGGVPVYEQIYEFIKREIEIINPAKKAFLIKSN